MTSLHWMTADELRKAIGAGQVSCEEVVRHHIERICALNPRLNALLTMMEEDALKAARRMDGMRHKQNVLPPLAGLPVVLKDNICTRGVRTTCGSRILENYVPPYDATVVAKLREAGALVLAKANLDEFAMGSSNENSAFSSALNPWDERRVPGGSSGGPAAAVAAGLAPLALGSDTGGSVKQPASFCGLVGLKPTYGRTSRYGLVAFASSLDGVGPLSRNVEDNLLLFSAISGADSKDSTCQDLPPVSGEPLDESVRGLRVGIPKEYFGPGLDPQVESAVMACARLFEEGGATLEEISLPHTEYGVAAYYVVATAEASSNLARYDGVRYGSRSQSRTLAETYEDTRSEGFGPEVKRRILLGTFVLSAGYYEAYYLRAQKARTLIQRDFDGAFARVDLLLCPTAPTTAFLLGEKLSDPLTMYLSDVYSVPANLAGLPGLSFPCGFSLEGLPIGAQIIGPRNAERRLYSAALFCEKALALLGRHPAGF